MYPILFNVCTVKLLSLTLYVNWEFVTESKSVAVTEHTKYTHLSYKMTILCAVDTYTTENNKSHSTIMSQVFQTSIENHDVHTRDSRP